MRVAIVAPPWLPVPPPGYGGTEAVIDVLARGLSDAGEDVLLWTTGDSTCSVPSRWILERAAGTISTGAATELHHVVNAYEAISEWGADLVHDHTLVGPIYGQRFGLPIVTTNHGPFASELADYYRAISGSVDVVALSRSHAESAVDTRVAAVIPHGVEVESFPLGAGTGGYALFLGRMSPDKGAHVAARVASEAGVPLVMAAKMNEPAEVAYFHSEVEPLLGAGVTYIGEALGAQKLALLAEATCLLNPIRWPEPFGMVMIEALACGTPVVATPWGSVPELVIDGVTGFVRADERGLAEALGMVSDLDRGSCRRDALERFSGQRMVEDHLRLYRSVR